MKINGKDICPFQFIFLIAETASSHEGQVELAKKLADGALLATTDAIKYQFLNADDLLVPSHHKYGSFKELQFSANEWKEIVGYARSLGLFVIAEIFDEKSLDLAVELDIGMIKIPTSDLANPKMLKKASSPGRALILSTGAATEEEICFAVACCEEGGCRDLILMHGYQSFPTRLEDTKFELIEILRRNYPSYLVGFADHIDAELDLALSYPLSAIGYGASVIEKHITLDRSLKGRDYYSALEPEEFKKMAGWIRDVEKGYGNGGPGKSSAEKKYRQLMKKMIVTNVDIAPGELITLDKISFRRTDEEGGLSPMNYEKILKKAVRFIPAYGVIKENDVA